MKTTKSENNAMFNRTPKPINLPGHHFNIKLTKILSQYVVHMNMFIMKNVLCKADDLNSAPVLGGV